MPVGGVFCVICLWRVGKEEYTGNLQLLVSSSIYSISVVRIDLFPDVQNQQIRRGSFIIQ